MEDCFTSFVCAKCNSEIEASPDLIGEETECPACGAKLIIPDNRADDVSRHTAGDVDPDSVRAMKSRTIRIELGDF
jgi:DNA-directed RNA polymerase subunit RPC12/RpoP